MGEYFQLTTSEMDDIIIEVQKAVSCWKKIAKDIGISRNDQELMASAFKY